MIVVASTRPGRVGLPVARWFERHARTHGAFDVDLVDLAELRLPFMDEPNHPKLHDYTHQHTKDWSARVDAADAFVFVMPEYNHGYTAPLKNAIDYLHSEWAFKPVVLLSYGGISAGTRAAQLLKPVLINLKMTPVAESVSIPFVAKFIDDEGDFQPNDVLEQSADTVLGELVKLNAALAPLRADA
jgi:NAD(P)H-dependent FMN reductase